MKLRLPVLLAGAIVLALMSGTASAADIVETAVAGNFTTLVAAVKAAGLVETLKGPGPFTVFAPTDEAFAKVVAKGTSVATAAHGHSVHVTATPPSGTSGQLFYLSLIHI